MNHLKDDHVGPLQPTLRQCGVCQTDGLEHVGLIDHLALHDPLGRTHACPHCRERCANEVLLRHHQQDAHFFTLARTSSSTAVWKTANCDRPSQDSRSPVRISN
ncbi:hypothetical protein BDZ89DRAFT_160844 [Hymenopellis radicata]|nr:hypothetical protein BDZ89DRAFT_160844 [Hymenopellis radicata]